MHELELLAPDWTALERIDPERVWINPLGLISGTTAEGAVAAGLASWLGSSGMAYAAAEIIWPKPEGGTGTLVLSRAALAQKQQQDDGPLAARLALLQARLDLSQGRWAGLTLDRPLVMGILNVTPDSFSDGGSWTEPDQAAAQGRALIAAGADIVDIGGESTRPGATPITVGEEMERVVPVIRRLAGEGAALSIDTRNADVMRAALAAGARIVNDVSALTHDPASLGLAAQHGAPVVLMHMRGDPRTMQHQPHYGSVVTDVLDHLEARVGACVAGGIPRERICIDPGIGFGKDLGHNLDLLAGVGALHGLGCPVLLGISRKGMIGRLSRAEPPAARLAGSIAAGLAALSRGARILRVHDVAETRQAIAIWEAIASR